MLTYDMESRGALSMYDYLYRCIRDDICKGKLKEGEKLPSKRTLAEHLGVSVITIENAYAQLAAEGYISPVEKRGYFICFTADEYHTETKNVKAADIEQKSDEEPFADFVSNSMRAEYFPFSVWAKLMRRALSESESVMLSADGTGGSILLRTAIADYLRRCRAMSVEPEQVIVGAGTEYLYNLLIQLLGRDKIYATEDPGYLKISQIYSLCGVGCERIEMDRDGILPERLDKCGAKVVHISPSHHYPTGTVTPAKRRGELIEWADKADGYIIEDDYDSEFRFSGRPIATMQSRDRFGRVIYINTFSKSLSPSLRISYMVLPQRLLSQFYKKLGVYSSTVPAIMQHTLAQFISEGWFERHISRMKNRYRVCRDIVISAIQKSRFADITQIEEADSGLHFILKLNTETPDSEIIKKAAANGIRLSCLNDHSTKPRKEYEHRLIINYSGVDPQSIADAVLRMEKAML